MKNHLYCLFIVLSILVSCTKKEDKTQSFSFYHWKSKAKFSDTYKEALQTTDSKRIYLHYFDIDTRHRTTLNNIYPTYVLKEVAPAYQQYHIIPVVYITNQVFKNQDLVVKDLAVKIKTLVNQISKTHFNKELKEIQIDCDWSQSTRNAYFELLTRLEKDFDIDVTIRLHQIKFSKITGVPPVKKGTLMLYNVGDLKNIKQNSILESTIVKQYINSKSAYSLPLQVGLPLFSQTVVFNNDRKIKIIKNTERAVLEKDAHFKKIDPTTFRIIKDTLYKGFYLSKDYVLKLEELQEKEIIASYKTIKESKLEINDIVFYHLDSVSLSKTNLKELVKKL